MSEQEPIRSELDLIDLIDMIWEDRLLVVAVTALFLAVGAAAYLLMPERFRSDVEITPLTGAKFADYADLVEANSFDYTRGTLAFEFAKYLTDRDRLAQAEEATQALGVTVNFTIEDENVGQGQGQARALTRLRMTATHGDEGQLDAFMADLLKRAGRDLAAGISAEIERRIEAAEEGRSWAIRRAEVLISAEREKLAAERKDTIEKLKKEAQVARSFGLERPIELQAQTLAIDRYASAPSSQWSFSGGQPPYPRYLDGYLALEEQASLLENQKSDDPFIPRLRDMQKDIYLLKNNTQKEQVTAILARSVLSQSDQAQFASYSLTEAKARKDPPRLRGIATAAFALGLLAGIGCAIFRGLRASRGRHARASAG